MKFTVKNPAHSTLHVSYEEKYLEETENTKFLGLQIDNHINWKKCIEEMIPNLSATCYAVRSVVHISSINKLTSIYCAHCHSVTKYGIIFWGNSFNSGKIFTLQEKIIRLGCCTNQNPL
jgi:hypothetical protein